MNTIVVTLHKGKSTKNFTRYEGTDQAMPTLYIRTSSLGSAPPATITVTVEAL